MARQSASNECSCAPMRQGAGPRAGIENRGITSPSLRDPRDSLIEELTSLHSARRLRAARLSLPCRGRPCKPKKRRPCRISFCIRSGPEYIQPGPNTKRVANSICTPSPVLAESEGFEPPEPCGSTVFKTAAIDHSANFPGTKVAPFFHSAKSLPRFIVRNGGPKIKIRR